MTRIILAGVFGIATACALAGICDPPPAKPQGPANIRPVQSMDPNEIVGPVGMGSRRYVEPGTWMAYTITDEEVKTITHPIAMDVVGELEVIPSRLKLRSRPGTQSLSVLIRPCKGADIAIISAETKPRKWGDARLHLRGKTGWRIDIDGVEYDKVRQFSKQPFLEVSTDSHQMPTVKVPLETP